MANTLSNLIPDAYRALDVVSRELVGFIPSVQLDPSAEQIGLNQNIRIPAAPANSAGKNITPAMSFPAAAYQTVTNTAHTLTKSRAYPFSWTQEEQKSVNTGPGFLTLQQGQIAQALRGLVNEIESDAFSAAYLGASRATGTAGTTPFASTLADTANVRKILDDNGAPGSDRSVVIDTTAGAALRTLAQLTKANEAGDTSLLRQGVLLNLHGFNVRESAQVAAVTAGSGASYQLNGAVAVGDTTIAVDTGSGTILAGDIVTINGHKYVVTAALSAGSFTIQAPGIRKATADNTAITVNATSTRNVAFSRNAILLSTRLPAAPDKDMAVDRQVITDPLSGISFELAMYAGYRMVHYEVSAVWGVTAIKPEHCAIMLG